MNFENLHGGKASLEDGKRYLRGFSALKLRN